MNNIVLSTLNVLLNQALNFDVETKRKLQQIEGKIVKLYFTNLNESISIRIHNQLISLDRLQVDNRTDIAYDVYIEGEIQNFIKIVLKLKRSKTLSYSDLNISGDTILCQELLSAFKSFQFDWEEWLSQYCGDIIAHHIGKSKSHLDKVFKNANDSLKSSLTEYIEEEIKLLPPKEEIENFCNDVIDLRTDLERFEIRWKHLDDIANKNNCFGSSRRDES